MTDKRKRRWIVLDMQYPRGHSTQELIRKLDSTAPGVWVALLTAAKRSKEQGTFEWFTETDAWKELGLNPDDFKYDWKTFITATGQLRMTNKTRSKHLQKIVITKWEDWQNTARTGSGRRQNPKESLAFSEQKARLNRAKPAPEPRHESESESESESERESGLQKLKPEPVENPVAAPPVDVTRILKEVGLTPTQPQPLPRHEQLKRLKDMQ